MSSSLSRLSFNINMSANMSEERLQKLFGVLSAWRPGYALAMNGYNPNDAYNNVARLVDHAVGWGGFIIYRHYDGKEHKFWEAWGSGRDHADYLIDSFGTRVIHHLGNEPRPGHPDDIRAMCRHAADFTDRALARNAKVVLINEAVASYTRAQKQGQEWHALWHTLADTVNVRQDGIPAVTLGTHSGYSAMPLPLGCGGMPGEARLNHNLVQPENWPDWSKVLIAYDFESNYHLFRDLDSLYQAHEVTGVDPFAIGVHWTECGGEGMPDLEVKTWYNQLIALNGGLKPRGTPTWFAYLEWAYRERGWSPQRAIAEMWAHIEREAPPNYLSFQGFSWTYDDNYPLRWAQDYGRQNLDELHQIWPAMVQAVRDNQGGGETVPETPITPQIVRITAIKTQYQVVNIRSGPAVTYPIASGATDKPLKPLDIITLEAVGVSDNNGTWRKMTRSSDNVQGWFADLNGKVTWEDVDTEPPVPPVPPTPDFTFTFPDGTHVSFANNSSGTEPLSYVWDFGDDDTSAAKDVIHEYGEPGTYTVTLTVTDANNASADTSQPVTVEDAAEPPPLMSWMLTIEEAQQDLNARNEELTALRGVREQLDAAIAAKEKQVDILQGALKRAQGEQEKVA